jgi:hypothetical protein
MHPQLWPLCCLPRYQRKPCWLLFTETMAAEAAAAEEAVVDAAEELAGRIRSQISPGKPGWRPDCV